MARNGENWAIFVPYAAILMGTIVFFCQILMSEIDFDVQEEPKNTVGNNGGKISEGGLPRKKISQKWPNFHHFWPHFVRFL